MIEQDFTINAEWTKFLQNGGLSAQKTIDLSCYRK